MQTPLKIVSPCIYVGDFKDGYRTGQGTYTPPDGSQDIGMYIDNDYILIACTTCIASLIAR